MGVATQVNQVNFILIFILCIKHNPVSSIRPQVSILSRHWSILLSFYFCKSVRPHLRWKIQVELNYTSRNPSLRQRDERAD